MVIHSFQIIYDINNLLCKLLLLDELCVCDFYFHCAKKHLHIRWYMRILFNETIHFSVNILYNTNNTYFTEFHISTRAKTRFVPAFPFFVWLSTKIRTYIADKCHPQFSRWKWMPKSCLTVLLSRVSKWKIRTNN